MENTTIKTGMNTGADTTKDVRGELTYDDKVIQKIIGIALENV
ncbi:MAG: Asp23/Gls24 family envelope stress response protein, partial [Enterococcus sp.]|nr:Asp23/Gls24 family envelope stress response protein [Enterococcus sp.]